MLMLTLTDDGGGTEDAEPLLVTRADPPLVRAILAVLVEHLTGVPAGLPRDSGTRRQPLPATLIPVPQPGLES
jgi:hypothetical protein